MQIYNESSRDLPIKGEYDVIVAGGGPTGVMAAIAAARKGCNTILLERYGFLGGTGTAALMVQFGSYKDGTNPIVGGVTSEFLDNMLEYGGAIERRKGYRDLTYDVESMISICQDMVLEAGVHLQLHTLIVEPIYEGKDVKGVIIETKSGREAILGKVVIDCTGDADLVTRAGGTFDFGRENDGRVQPASLEVILGGVDSTRIPDSVWDVVPAVEQGIKDGEWPIPTDRIFSWGIVEKRGAEKDPKKSYFLINATNALDIDGTNVESLTKGEIETRKQVDPLINFLRKRVSGFEKCYLDRAASQIGIRETRRIHGEYTLTAEDVLSAKHFEDGLVAAHNSIDVHDIDGKNFLHDYLEAGMHYEIPYRCFLPKDLNGILVAGRTISCDHRALGSCRVMIICMPMGDAVGRAAAMAVKSNCSLKEIDIQELKNEIRKDGCPLSEM